MLVISFLVNTDQGAYTCTCTSGSPFTFCKCRSLCNLCITNIFNPQNITQRSSWCTHTQKDLLHVIKCFELLFKKFHPPKEIKKPKLRQDYLIIHRCFALMKKKSKILSDS